MLVFLELGVLEIVKYGDDDPTKIIKLKFMEVVVVLV